MENYIDQIIELKRRIFGSILEVLQDKQSVDFGSGPDSYPPLITIEGDDEKTGIVEVNRIYMRYIDDLSFVYIDVKYIDGRGKQQFDINGSFGDYVELEDLYMIYDSLKYKV